MASIEVISPGPLTTIQDLGRPGWAHIGVPRSGAADRPSLRLANRLVGNREDAPGLETTLMGPRLRMHGEITLALTGAPVSAKAGERSVSMGQPVTLADGEVLSFGAARVGLRTYLAFQGGLEVPRVLGSAATDVLTGLGPRPLSAGDELEVGGNNAVGTGATGREPVASEARPGSAELQVALGPRDDWFTAAAVDALTSAAFTVSSESNRTGLRLTGARLERARNEELLSEGIMPGAIQVPPSGDPILLLADHPTTGGYPVIATVINDCLPLAAQLRPGQTIRFTI